MTKGQFLLKKNIGIFILILGLGLVAILGFSIQQKGISSIEQQGECAILHGTGKQTYNVLTDNPQNPQIVQIDVDPIDVKMGGTQKITVKVVDKNNSTITSKSGVSADIFTDDNAVAIASSAFKLIKAEDEKNNSKSLVTFWEGYWVKNQETCYTYAERITATNDKGEESFITVTFK